MVCDIWLLNDVCFVESLVENISIKHQNLSKLIELIESESSIAQMII